MSRHDDMVDAFAHAILDLEPSNPTKWQKFKYWLMRKIHNIYRWIAEKVGSNE